MNNPFLNMFQQGNNMFQQGNMSQQYNQPFQNMMPQNNFNPEMIGQYLQSMMGGMMTQQTENMFEWEKWTKDIPYISLPEGTEIKILPPSGGVVSKFSIRKKGSNHNVLVFLDAYDNVNKYGKPYWGINSAALKETEKIPFEDINELEEKIEELL